MFHVDATLIVPTIRRRLPNQDLPKSPAVTGGRLPRERQLQLRRLFVDKQVTKVKSATCLVRGVDGRDLDTGKTRKLLPRDWQELLAGWRKYLQACEKRVVPPVLLGDRPLAS